MGKIQATPTTRRRPMTQIDQKPALRVLRLPAVLARTGLSRSTVFAKLNLLHQSFDPSFPKRIRLGLRAVGWIESELDDWIKKSRRH